MIGRYIRYFLLLTLLLLSVPQANGQAKKKAVFEDIYEDLPVVDPAAAIDPNDTSLKKIRRSIVVTSELSKTTCYPGEPIKLTFRLYSALKSKSEIVRYPGLQGFVVEKKMLENEYPVNKVVQGRVFRVFDLVEYKLYPIDAGVLRIDSMTISNNIKTSVAGRDFTETVSSNPVLVSVIPFPAAGKPIGFKGAIGAFGIRSYFPDTVRFMKTDTFHVVITGQGNLTRIEKPEINWPSGIEVFDPVIEYSIKEKAFPDSGSVIFKYPVTVNDQFVHKIPSIILYYFNPATRKYIESVAKEVEFQMIEGGTENMPQKTEEESVKVQKRNWWIYVLGVSALLTIAYFIARKKKTERLDLEVKQAAETEHSVLEEPPPDRDFISDVIALRTIEHPLLYVQEFKKLLNEFMVDVSEHPEKELSQERLDALTVIVNECDMYIYSGAIVPSDIKQRFETAFKRISS